MRKHGDTHCRNMEKEYEFAIHRNGNPNSKHVYEKHSFHQ